MKSFLIVVSISFLVACGANTPVKSSGASVNQGATASRSAQTYRDFCDSLVELFYAGEKDAFVKKINIDALVRSTFFGKNINAEEQRQMRASLRTSYKDFLRGYERSFNLQQWSVLSVTDEGEKGRCVMHTEIGEKGAYLEEFLLARENNTISIVNWFDHVNGFFVSDHVSSIVKSMFAMVKQNSDQQAYKSDLSLLTNFIAENRRLNAVKAWSAYDQLPDALKNNRMFAQMLIQGTSNNEALHRKALDNYAALVDKSSTDRYGIIFYDYYFYNKNYNKALEVIADVESRLGKAAMFEMLRAAVYQEQGKEEAFFYHSYKSLETDLSFQSTYWILLDHFVATDRYADAVMVLDVLRKAFDYQISGETFSELEEYRMFLSSSEFRSWVTNI